jgi:hypothetical protein
MRNAKEEFLSVVQNQTVLCAEISYRDCWEHKLPMAEYRLILGHTQDQYNAFIESLDFSYDAGYGGQELFGVIWFKDGSWADRGEYDGSEWWQHQTCPGIPKTLIFPAEVQ